MVTPTATPGNGTATGSIAPGVTTLSFFEQTIATIVLLGVFGLGLWASREIRRRVDAGDRQRALNLFIGIALASLGVSVGLLLVSIWTAELSELSAFSFLSVKDPGTTALRFVITILMVVGVYVLNGFVKDFIYRLTEETTALTQHQTELLYRSTQVLLYVLAVLIIFSIWDVDLGGLLVGAGFLGIVVGLAARQTLGSLIAGFVLMFARPFEIGDWVEIGDREGIVTEISVVNTRIQTFDGEYAMIPNDTVGASEVVNRTRKGRLRLRLDVGVDYATDLDHAIETAMDAMTDLEDVLSVPQPQVVLKSFDNSAIVLQLRFWIDKPSSRRRWRARTAVIRSVKAAFDAEGIKIPFPQRELMGRSEAGGFRIADEHDGPESPGDASIGGDGE